MMRTLEQLKRSMIAMLLVVCMICTNTLPAFADQAVASTMRLAKTEGKVSVTNKNGRDMGTMADMKLFNGYNLGTEQASYAWIGLDDSKIVKLDAVSEAEIQKKGKDLEVLLNSGNLFFNVTESLKADETLNIRTSTMVTGIRGTCGWVKVLDSWRTEVFILEGSVECWVMDPVTGQAKTVRLGAGQKATFVVYDQMREGDKCDIIMGTYGENDIDPFVAVELLNDSDLRDRVGGATGFNIGAIVNGAEERLDAKEQDVNQKNQVVQNQLFNQPNTVKDPVFETNRDDGGQGSGGGSGSGGSSSGGTSGGGNTTIPGEELDPEPEEVDTIELQMPVTAAELNEYLQSYNVILHGSGSPNGDILSINTTVTVPERGEEVTELAVDEDVTISVNEDCELRVNGTLDTQGSVTNNGIITNTSDNTLKIAGYLQNNDGAEINNTGRMVVSDGFANYGDVNNSGEMESDLNLYGGVFNIMQGSVLEDSEGYAISMLILEGGDVNVWSGTYEGASIRSGCLTLNDGVTIGRIEVDDINAQSDEGGTVAVPTNMIMNAGTVENLEVIKGLVYVAGGNVDSATIGNPDFSSGYVTRMIVTGGSVNETIVNGGTLDVTTNGVVENVNGQYGFVMVKNGTVGTATMTGADLDVTGGSIEVVDQTTGEFYIEGDAYVDTADVSDALVTTDGGVIDSLQVTDGTVEIINGEFGSLTFNSTTGTMWDGNVTDGMKITGTFPHIELSGGTISAGSADAAIEVDAVARIETVTVREVNSLNIIKYDPSSDTYNDNVDVVIDGGDKTAILVESGIVEVDIRDMVDTYEDGTLIPAEESVIVKSSNNENIIRIAEGENTSVYVPGTDKLFFNQTIHMLFQKDTNGSYILKQASEYLGTLVSTAQIDETIVLNNDVSGNGNTSPEDIAVANKKRVILDLNGHEISANAIFVNDFAELTIIDSKSTGSLECSRIQNESTLNLDGINVVTGKISNDGTMTITNTDIVAVGGNNDESYGVFNENTMTVNGGIWVLDYLKNYDTISLSDVQVEVNGEIQNDGDMTITSGELIGNGYTLITNRGGNLLLKDGVKMSMTGTQAESIDAVITAWTGTVQVGDEGDDPITIDEDGCGYAVIYTTVTPNTSNVSEWDDKIVLENVEINSGESSAIHLRNGYELVVGDGVEITSESIYGTITCEALKEGKLKIDGTENPNYVDPDCPLEFNGGMIINTSNCGVGVINQHFDEYYYVLDESGAVDVELSKTRLSGYFSDNLIPDTVGTILVSNFAKYDPTDNNDQDSPSNVATNSYFERFGEYNDPIYDSLIYVPYTSSNASQSNSLSLMSLRPATPSDAETATDSDAIEGDLPDENDDILGGSGDDDVIGDSSDNDDDDTSSDDIETSTDSDAAEKEDSTETASGGNATGNGDPMTGSPAAIPLAAALLGIWMSMPKEYKRRNRKEC